MWPRFIFLVITVFWAGMNFLLWRSETGASKKVGNAVSLDLVLEKILTAPDASSLEIFHHGKKIGFCRLVASVGLEANKSLNEDFRPEGMVEQPSDYKLDLDGNITLAETTNRIRFEIDFRISTNYQWQEFNFRAHSRSNAWEIHTDVANQKVRLIMDDIGDRWEQSLTFEQLRHPQTLLHEFGGPMTFALFGALGNLGLPMPGGTNTPLLSPGLKWEANNDSMRFGHSRVRVYRLHTKLLQRLDVFIFVSRVGEILWVDLPDQIVLSNDAFTHF
ncbi:MAG: hypothetical protein ABJC04_09920 [Verrucomicrobiota bacterium]